MVGRDEAVSEKRQDKLVGRGSDNVHPKTSHSRLSIEAKMESCLFTLAAHILFRSLRICGMDYSSDKYQNKCCHVRKYSNSISSVIWTKLEHYLTYDLAFVTVSDGMPGKDYTIQGSIDGRDGKTINTIAASSDR